MLCGVPGCYRAPCLLIRKLRFGSVHGKMRLFKWVGDAFLRLEINELYAKKFIPVLRLDFSCAELGMPPGLFVKARRMGFVPIALCGKPRVLGLLLFQGGAGHLSTGLDTTLVVRLLTMCVGGLTVFAPLRSFGPRLSRVMLTICCKKSSI